MNGLHFSKMVLYWFKYCVQDTVLSKMFGVIIGFEDSDGARIFGSNLLMSPQHSSRILEVNGEGMYI